MTVYNLGAVKDHVADAAHEIGNKFGLPSGAIGGFGYRPQNPSSDHPKGLALDFMVYDNTALGDSIAAYGIANYKRLGIRYIIWNKDEWWPGQGWKGSTGSYSPHTDHPHFSFNAVPGDTSAEPVEGTEQFDIPGPWNADKPRWYLAFERFDKWAGDPHNWSRVGIVLVGFLLMIIMVKKGFLK